ncbi:Sec-independent protein translocase protein TatB [Pseudomonas sp. OF001]|jgi:sec-independent protein translocase protein TatB|uniref:Sec-independent protein translocase protein TatB n=2 Tax=Pseudomonas TaxID=286 RepID=UPI00191886DE|nr:MULTISPECIES: Sec-independent protein translocase protein TatB [unclassified Pseudomonas]WPP45166.1 Sec-independent protein translocase protein TatB [Pseudomonas sp. AN-1]CAD5375379.1 Sec-independent protein translocase protein TatB [Pseudomonas sp. OF001]
MFDVGFSELLLVALVALVVLGPERLPGAARTAGLWIGRLKRSFAAIKTEVEREIGADEIRLQLHNEQILERERQQQAAQTPASPPPAPTAEQANAPIAAHSRLAALPEHQAGAQIPAGAGSDAASPAARRDSAPAAPSEPPRPT